MNTTKNTILTLGILMGLFAGSIAQAEDKAALLRHIVAFNFTAETGVEQKQQVTKEFLKLKTLIPSIVSLEAGLNNSTEGLNHGFTHVFIVSFKNLEDRENYVYRNPFHEKFKALVGPLLGGDSSRVIVLDF